MKQFHHLLLLTAGLMLTCCNPDEVPSQENSSVTDPNSITFSFAFVGCNRIYWLDENNEDATNGSTANVSVLKRLFSEIVDLERQPELFFFLGDMILGESTTEKLDRQLDEWTKQYEDTSFSKISQSGIELVAIPGNHEMLYYKDYNIPNRDEWPLEGSTEIWMKHMGQHMPEDRERITGVDSVINQMTFSFVRQNVGFVVMNTDTYNEATPENPYGVEGIIPTQWIIDKVHQYQKDPSIDHVFVLGHKPYYIDGKPETGHLGLPAGPVLWPKLEENHVVAMLSAHYHDYQRMQPNDEGTYQIIAGNGGSKGWSDFYGFSLINILNNGNVELISKGFDVEEPYYKTGSFPTTTRDSTYLTW